MTSPYYEGYVRARAASVSDPHTVVDEIFMPVRTGVRYRVGRTLVTLGTQLMGARTASSAEMGRAA